MRAQSPALLVLVISHDILHMVQKFMNADISDLVVDVDRLESRAGAPVIGHSGVLAAPLLGNGREERLAGGTPRAGISFATPDNDNLPQSLVEIEWRSEPVLISHESSIALGILPAKPFGQPNVDVRQALLVPTDEGVAKFTPAHTVIAQKDHHRIVQNASLFQKREFLEYTRVHRRDTVHVVVADGVGPEEAKVRRADEGLGEIHGIVKDSFETQLGTGTVFHVESADKMTK